MGTGARARRWGRETGIWREANENGRRRRGRKACSGARERKGQVDDPKDRWLLVLMLSKFEFWGGEGQVLGGGGGFELLAGGKKQAGRD